MRCWAAFHGGASYAPETEATEYPSLTAAKDEYARRCGRNWTAVRSYPNWGDKVERGDSVVGYIYLYPVTDTTDMYPDRILISGPKGGLRFEPA